MILFRSLTINPPIILAPMAGLTHSAFRQLVLKFGGVGLLSTEMLSAKALPRENPNTSPYLIRKENEKPLSYQLLIRDEGDVFEAIETLHKLGADAIDINMGCPAPIVKKSGGGISLAENPEKAVKIVRTIRNLTHLPLSAKIRLGREPSIDSLKGFCLMLEDAGIDMLTIHARFHHESFDREPKWEYIKPIKEALKIPVIANGGIFSVEDARRCLEITGADGLMIGRGVAIKPWLIAEIARDVYNHHLGEIEIDFKETFLAFYRELSENFPKERQLGRLKEWIHYFSKNFLFGHELASKVQSSHSMEEAYDRAMDFLGGGKLF